MCSHHHLSHEQEVESPCSPEGGSLLLVDVHVHIHAQAYSLMLRLSTPVYQGRDVICLV